MYDRQHECKISEITTIKSKINSLYWLFQYEMKS